MQILYAFEETSINTCDACTMLLDAFLNTDRRNNSTHNEQYAEAKLKYF